MMTHDREGIPSMFSLVELMTLYRESAEQLALEGQMARDKTKTAAWQTLAGSGALGAMIQQAIVVPMSGAMRFTYTRLPDLTPLLRQDPALRAEIGSYFPSILATLWWYPCEGCWMSDLSRVAVLDALDAAYRNVTAVAGGLGEADLMRPSRCAGWAVADVLLGPSAGKFPVFA